MEPISYENQRSKFVWQINLSGLRFISVDVNLSITGRERVWGGGERGERGGGERGGKGRERKDKVR